MTQKAVSIADKLYINTDGGIDLLRCNTIVWLKDSESERLVLCFGGWAVGFGKRLKVDQAEQYLWDNL